MCVIITAFISAKIIANILIIDYSIVYSNYNFKKFAFPFTIDSYFNQQLFLFNYLHLASMAPASSFYSFQVNTIAENKAS